MTTLQKGNIMEEIFIELAQMLKREVIESLERQEIAPTPQNIIAEFEEVLVMAKAEFDPASLPGTMIPAMLQWFIDQEKLNLLIAT
jgi:hypothetical protein